jgi:hypothetical protein
MQPERRNDAPVKLLTERAAAGCLHDQAEQVVAGVGVRPGRARREVRRLVGHQGHQLPRGPVARSSPRGSIQRLFDGRPVVGHAAGVIEQLAEGDLLAVGQDPRQPTVQAVLQRQPALRDQLQHDGGDQRLGQAAGAEVQLGSHRPAGAQVGHAAGGRLGAVVVLDPAGGAGRPGRHQLIQQPLQRLHRPPSSPVCGVLYSA